MVSVRFRGGLENVYTSCSWFPRAWLMVVKNCWDLGPFLCRWIFSTTGVNGYLDGYGKHDATIGWDSETFHVFSILSKRPYVRTKQIFSKKTQYIYFLYHSIMKYNSYRTFSTCDHLKTIGFLIEHIFLSQHPRKVAWKKIHPKNPPFSGPGCPWCEKLHPVLENVPWKIHRFGVVKWVFPKIVGFPPNHPF